MTVSQTRLDVWICGKLVLVLMCLFIILYMVMKMIVSTAVLDFSTCFLWAFVFMMILAALVDR